MSKSDKEKIREEVGQSVVVTLLTGKDAENRDRYTYFAVRLDKLKEFKQAGAEGRVNLEDFGMVLETGLGLTPPDDVKAMMTREYGFNHENSLPI